jgi:DNA-directed RNA polymerase subunit beta'
VGRLIPAGTGSVMNRLRAIATGRADERSLRQDKPALASEDIAAE